MATWKVIEGFEGYSVSDDGQVKNNISGRILSQHLSGSAYYRVQLSKNGMHKTFLIHRLVAKAFLPNPNNKPHVDHSDGNPVNNQASNLRWATVSENQMNKGKQKNNTSGVKGISWDKASQKWRVQITKEGKDYNLGCFNALEEAKAVREAKALELHGSFNRL